ncbi:MAG TPA: ATP-binding cassette domain-containing protein, partial [Mycobacteriales bacterium]|nr:ATP-binding cassette domain-containing protein [Mycobacteriales bacterium]
MTLLAVDDLSVRFRTEDGPVLAVDEASFEVAEREVVALVGESGCGKSVTALALTDLLPRNATVTGAIELDGSQPSRQARGRDIAYIFQ